MHVYVLEAVHGCKIGISTQPTRRLRGLQTQGGFAATRAWVSLPTDRAAEMERAAHARLSGSRGLGEWFAVDFDHAVSAVCAAPVLPPKPELRGDTIADRIKIALSQSAKLTQRGIANACGISDAAVSQWVSGSTQNIRPDNLFATADYLGVSARWLATGKGD